MLLHVLHETAYDYVPMVRTAQHMAHLKPADGGRQRLLSHKLTVDPGPVQPSEQLDAFGNVRSFLSLQFPHEFLSVQAESLVRTIACEPPRSVLPWEEAAERMRYHRRARYDPAAGFAFASPYVPRDAEFVDYAQASFTAGRPLLDAT